jgi:patatin-related protein
MANSAPKTDYVQETRFAVVMYGGVSLAIYINGIAQELFHLVRSTAPSASGSQEALHADELSPTERVYRKVSHLLSNRNLRLETREAAKANAKGTLMEASLNDALPIPTRFVVDILSGTSAGGINAIYLAKALANDQRIDQLKELWVNEGDIDLLMNDERSVANLGLKNQHPPQSLLNSRRMYLKLLCSLDDMEKSNPSTEKFRSPYVEELDLFITTTDIKGVPLPIRLSDSLVFERRHRNVFHLKYASEMATEEYRNDFVRKNNPFLAFSARCTSSFPFAFQPMRLCDINEVLDSMAHYRNDPKARANSEDWLPFLSSLSSDKANLITERAFSDGGCLDNKPFTYATDTIARRQAVLPVDRKLIYIEPSPEHPEDEIQNDGVPDALQNVKAALLDLPTYETIREDLERLMQRNELLSRVNKITDDIERDMESSGVARPHISDDEWAKLDLIGMVQRFGIYYIPYRRLRIEATTDELAKTVARVSGLDPKCAEFTALRALIVAWRNSSFPETFEREGADPSDRIYELTGRLAELIEKDSNSQKIEKARSELLAWVQERYPDLGSASAEQKPKISGPAADEPIRTANQFLSSYDFKYWLRRFGFIRLKIDELLQLLMGPVLESNTHPRSEEFGLALNLLSGKQRRIVEKIKTQNHAPIDLSQLTKTQKEELKSELNEIKAKLSDLHKKLRVCGRKLYAHDGVLEKAFAETIRGIGLGSDVLNYILGTVKDDLSEQTIRNLREDECYYRAKQLLDSETGTKLNVPTLKADLDQAADILRRVLRNTLKRTWVRGKKALSPDVNLNKDASEFTKALKHYLWPYFSRFDDYDQIRFPILYGSEVGESDVVEVFRISPEDATSLINERDEGKKSNGRFKLAGTALHHFGAFLDRSWRQNDIMWGRLDGAERLITALLSKPADEKVRESLIREAHLAILEEELCTESSLQLSGLLTDALVKASSGEPIEDSVQKVTNELIDSVPIRTELNTVMQQAIKPEQLLDFMQKGYRINTRLDPETLLKSISRSTQIIGGIFEDLADRNNLDGRSLSWIAKLGQIFWGLVQVAIPNSLLNKLATHWLYILYLFEILTILGGTLLSRSEVSGFGWTALGITAALHIVTLILNEMMRGMTIVKRTITKLAIVLVGGLTVVGALKVLGLLGYTVGDPPATPLSWMGKGLRWLLGWLGPLSLKTPVIVALVGVVLVLIFLRLLAAGKLRWLPFLHEGSAGASRPIQEIKLRRFKKDDMQRVVALPDGKAYMVPFSLNESPTKDWIGMFYELWSQRKKGLDALIFQSTVRIDCDLAQVASVWIDLRTTIDQTNLKYRQDVEKDQQTSADYFSKQEKDNKESFENKWKKLKALK